MSRELHVRNLERENEILKGVLFDTLNVLHTAFTEARDHRTAAKIFTLREEIDSISPQGWYKRWQVEQSTWDSKLSVVRGAIEKDSNTTSNGT